MNGDVKFSELLKAVIVEMEDNDTDTVTLTADVLGKRLTFDLVLLNAEDIKQ